MHGDTNRKYYNLYKRVIINAYQHMLKDIEIKYMNENNWKHMWL